MSEMRLVRQVGAATAAVLTVSALAWAGAVFAAAGPTSKPAGTGAPASQPSPHGGKMPISPHGPGGPTSQPAGGSTAAPIPPPPVRPILRAPTPVKGITLRAYHRVFHDFVDDNKTTMYAPFPVGDTEYTAEVVEYVPDFALNLKTRAVISRSEQPNNPAVRVLVLEKGVPQDTVWAMLNMPPHFARNSLLAFQIRRIELKNHAPIVTPEAAPTRKGATPPPTGQKVGGAKKP